MSTPADNSKDSWWRRWFGPLLRASNPILAEEARRCRRRWRRSAGIALLLLLLWAQSGFSILFQLSSTTHGQDLPWGMDNTIFGNLFYYAQFAAFHFVLYFVPLTWVLVGWSSRRASGHWSQMIQTPATRADLFWSFVLPRTVLLFLFLYVFYMTMWPWNHWWLIRFDDPDPNSWTQFHVIITTLYFITMLLFNMTAAVWAGLRTRSTLAASLVFLVLTIGLDCAGYVFACQFISISNFAQPAKALFTWPDFLYILLCLHAHPVFAAIFYPVKWAMCGFMIFDITRRIPARRWAAATDEAK